MSTPLALIDSNVIVGLVAEEAPNHARCVHLAAEALNGRLAIASHSVAEAFVTLTKRGGVTPFGWSPDAAWIALDGLLAVTRPIGLSPSEQIAAIRSYAAGGGVGARLYDRLIGEVAVRHGIHTIVTWDIGHYRDLFRQLRVIEPPEFAAA